MKKLREAKKARIKEKIKDLLIEKVAKSGKKCRRGLKCHSQKLTYNQEEKFMTKNWTIS